MKLRSNGLASDLFFIKKSKIEPLKSSKIVRSINVYTKRALAWGPICLRESNQKEANS